MHQRVRQYEAGLPVGFSRSNGSLVPFEQAAASPSLVAPNASLTDRQRRELALARIRKAAAWPERVYFPGGAVGRDRAIKEIETSGELAHLLIEHEANVAAWVIERLMKESGDA
jgi:hypothetical protein